MNDQPLLSSNTSQSNPTWSREELILALDLYLRHREALPSKHHPDVQELSVFLGKLGRTKDATISESFRNPNGVYMKLGNFRRWDPGYTKDGKTGLAKGNKDEEVVWNDFASSPAKLAAIVHIIRTTVELGEHAGFQLHEADEPDIHEAAEGRVITRLHRARERNRKLVDKKKKQALAKHGKLACEACGFDFKATYGSAGEGLIDVHHIRPLHTLEPGQKTRLDDLALLCANCHRVVHGSRHWLNLEGLKAALIQPAKTV